MELESVQLSPEVTFGRTIEFSGHGKVRILDSNGEEVGVIKIDTSKDKRPFTDKTKVMLILLRPIIQIAFPEGNGVGDGSYFTDMERAVKFEKGGREEFYEDLYRYSCAVLQGEGRSAEEVAELILDMDPRTNRKNAVFNGNKKMLEIATTTLKDTLLSYYPANTPQFKR